MLKNWDGKIEIESFQILVYSAYEALLGVEFIISGLVNDKGLKIIRKNS